MALSRAAKTVKVQVLTRELEASTSAIVGTFTGLTASKDFDLRKTVRAAGGSYHVVKNKLAAKASQGSKIEAALQGLKGVSAVAYTSGDPVQLAKALSTWVKDNAEFTFKLGIVDGKVIDVAEIGALATMPGKEELFSTRVVSVSAVVLDSHGLPVRDLPKEDFALKQDGKPQQIRYFSEDSDLPLTLSLLVDTSGSEKAYLEEEVLDSEVFFKAMMRRPTDRSALYQFDIEARKVQGLTPSVQTLINSLNFLTIPRGATMDATRGGTKLYDAVVAAALASEGRDRGRRALVLLTDGEDVGSRATLEQAIAMAQRADVVVYAVLIGAPEPSRSHAPAGAMSRGSDVLRDISSATEAGCSPSISR